jgi:hypothetical protein
MHQRTSVVKIAAFSLLVASVSFATGCYEDVSPQSSQTQTKQPPPKEGPITSMGQSGSSALGKAKQSATNIADQAEQRSRQVADEADKLMDPDGDRPGTGAEEPVQEP